MVYIATRNLSNLLKITYHRSGSSIFSSLFGIIFKKAFGLVAPKRVYQGKLGIASVFLLSSSLIILSLQNNPSIKEALGFIAYLPSVLIPLSAFCEVLQDLPMDLKQKPRILS